MSETEIGRVVELPASVGGVLLLSEMPGSERPLDEWLAGAEARQTDLIVNLAEEEELANISPEYLAYMGVNGGIEITTFPIPDYSVPVDMVSFHELIAEVTQRLWSGECVIVHCRAGIGRSGLFAASLLTSLNISFSEVLQRVQSAGGKFETEAQRLFLQEYRLYLGK